MGYARGTARVISRLHFEYLLCAARHRGHLHRCYGYDGLIETTLDLAVSLGVVGHLNETVLELIAREYHGAKRRGRWRAYMSISQSVTT